MRCVEASTEVDVQKRASQCAKTVDVAWKDIHACAKGKPWPASRAEWVQSVVTATASPALLDTFLLCCCVHVQTATVL